MSRPDPITMLPDGMRDILGQWIVNIKGSKFWMKSFNHLSNRDVANTLIAITDGLKGQA